MTENIQTSHNSISPLGCQSDGQTEIWVLIDPPHGGSLWDGLHFKKDRNMQGAKIKIQ